MYTYPNGKSAADVYNELHKSQNYGRSFCGHGRDLEHFLAGCTSLLDVGCGRSHFAWHVKQLGIVHTIQGCDLSGVAAKWQSFRGLPCVVGDLSEGLPFNDRTWAGVTAFDVLEHIQPDAVQFAIQELARVARKIVLLTIAHGRADKGPEREPLHLTVQPPEWWEAQFIEALGRPAKLEQLRMVRQRDIVSSSVWTIDATA